MSFYEMFYRFIPSRLHVSLRLSLPWRIPQSFSAPEPHLSIRGIFKAAVMTWRAPSQTTKQQASSSSHPPTEPSSPSTFSNGQGTSVICPGPHFSVLSQSCLCRPVFCFLFKLSAVNILHQVQTITAFIFASSFTGVACAIYTSR